MSEYTYDLDGKPTQVKLDGQVFAVPAYTSTQELASISYAGQGSALASVIRDGAGWVSQQQWTFQKAATNYRPRRTVLIRTCRPTEHDPRILHLYVDIRL